MVFNCQTPPLMFPPFANDFRRDPTNDGGKMPQMTEMRTKAKKVHQVQCNYLKKRKNLETLHYKSGSVERQQFSFSSPTPSFKVAVLC